MEQEKDTLPSYVSPAGYGKSTFAFLLDALFCFLLSLGIYYAIGKPAILPATHYEENQTAMNAFIEDSGLTEEGGVYKSYDAYSTDEEGHYGYQRYQSVLENYYTVFIKTNENYVLPESSGLTHSSSDEDFQKYALKMIYQLNPDGTVIEGGNDPYFELDTSTDAPYDVKVKEAYSSTDAASLNLSDLKTYFYDGEKKTGVYSTAIQDFIAQKYYLNLNNEINKGQYLSMLPSFIASPIIIFLVLPLCLPKGKTLGKLIFGTALVGKDGYLAPKLNVALHGGCLALVFELMCLPNSLLAGFFVVLILLIDYIFLILSKTHQSLHDKIARTVVVDSRASELFKNEEEEKEYAKEHPEFASRLEEESHQKDAVDEYGRQPLQEDAILDLSTINARREEARNMENFDEFEATHGGVQPGSDKDFAPSDGSDPNAKK